jgi:hypothetical protein
MAKKEIDTTAAKAEVAAAKRRAAAVAKMTATQPGDTFETLAVSVAKGAASDYGATGRYAALLNATFGSTWLDVELPTRAQAAKLKPGDNVQAALFANRNNLYDELDARNYPNPSVIWGRIRKHSETEAALAAAAAAAKAKEKLEAAMTPEEKAEAEKADAAAKAQEKAKDLLNRVLDNLRALDNAMTKVGPANLADEMRKAQVKMQEAIKALDANYIPAVVKTSK